MNEDHVRYATGVVAVSLWQEAAEGSLGKSSVVADAVVTDAASVGSDAGVADVGVADVASVGSDVGSIRHGPLRRQVSIG